MIFTKEQIKEKLKEAYIDGLDNGYMQATRYEEPDADKEFEQWFYLNYEKL